MVVQLVGTCRVCTDRERAESYHYYLTTAIPICAESDSCFDGTAPASVLDLSLPDAVPNCCDSDSGLDCCDPDSGLDCCDPDPGLNCCDPDHGLDCCDPDPRLETRDPDRKSSPPHSSHYPYLYPVFSSSK